MEISTEISQKIRSAIKAKLIELGAYVDDELPDYIMVMVANKKTQQQMTDDLNLFLGVNTEKFTTWLHSLLKKLQSINSNDPPPPAKEKHKQKHEKSGKHDKHDKTDKHEKGDKQDKSDKIKNVKRKRSHSEKTKSTDSGKHHKKTSGDVSAADSARVTKHKRHSTESADTTEVSSHKRKHSGDAGEVTEVTKQKKAKSVERVAKGDKSEEKKAVVVPEKQEKKEGEEEKTEINITENTDEFSEEVRVEEKKETKKTSKTAKPVKEKDVPKQKTSKTTKDKGDRPKESSKSKPSSVVGTVKRKFVDEDEDEEEEYDPLNPAVGAVASTIRAPARKSSVPKSLQANRSLLMRAVSDAEKSVKDVKKDDVVSSKPVQKVSPDLRGRLKTAAGLQLMSKSRRKEGLESMKYTVDYTEKSDKSKVVKKGDERLKDLKLTVKNEEVPAKKKKVSPKSKAPPVAPARMAQEALRSISKNPVLTKTIQQDDGEDSDGLAEDEYGPPLPDSRLVRHTEVLDRELSPQLSETNQSDPDIGDSNQSDGKPPSDDNNLDLEQVTDPEIQQLLDVDDDYTLTLDSDRPGERSVTPTDPKFIVTLDGVDPSAYRMIQEERQPPYVQTVKPSPQYPVIPVQPIQPELVKLEELPKSDSPLLYSNITPPKIKPFNISLKDTDDEDEGEGEEDAGIEAEASEESATDIKAPAVLERCRFWPACANGNDCQYIHPSTPCKTFPYCKFGDKCIYIHPNCKYDARCTRMDCPFTHATRRASTGGFLPQTVIHQYLPMPFQSPRPPRMPQQPPSLDCKFYPNCHNMNCPFNHPKPCRFGVSCMNKGSCRFYHPGLPTKDKMKWSAGDLTKLDPQKGEGDAAKMASRASSSSL